MNTIGSSNTTVGNNSLSFNVTGSNNTVVGEFALAENTTGTANVAMGDIALIRNITGSDNTAIGSQADVSTDGFSNATAIGANTIVNASNKVRIGNGAVTVIEGQVPFTTPSDGRYKFNVREDVKGLDFILHLRPVTYQFDTKRFDASMNRRVGDPATASAAATGPRPGNYAMQTGYDEASLIRRTGFIAQEVEQAANASGYDFSGIIKPKSEQDHYSLSYDAFVVPLVRAVQEQQEIIREQDKRILTLEQENRKINDLQLQLDEIKKLLRSRQ
jgi:hypothetical protein